LKNARQIAALVLAVAAFVAIFYFLSVPLIQRDWNTITDYWKKK
jgi:hypothetical protein